MADALLEIATEEVKDGMMGWWKSWKSRRKFSDWMGWYHFHTIHGTSTVYLPIHGWLVDFYGKLWIGKYKKTRPMDGPWDSHSFCSSKRVESWWKLDSHYQLRDFRGFYRPNQQTLRSFPWLHEEHMENSDMMKYDEIPSTLEGGPRSL